MRVHFIRSAFKRSDFPPQDRPEIAFAGRSNSGKSSLINTICKSRSLARVSSKPGKTRSINFYDIDGRYYFADLPGYGFAKVSKGMRESWRSLIESYFEGRDNLCAVVLIMDIRREPEEDEKMLMEYLNYHKLRVIPVLTKKDKVSNNEARKRQKLAEKFFKDMKAQSPLLFSSRTGEGVKELWSRILNSISKH